MPRNEEAFGSYPKGALGSGPLTGQSPPIPTADPRSMHTLGVPPQVGGHASHTAAQALISAEPTGVGLGLPHLLLDQEQFYMRNQIIPRSQPQCYGSLLSSGGRFFRKQQVSRCCFPKIICSLCVSVSHFGNSCNISFCSDYLFVTMVCDQ